MTTTIDFSCLKRCFVKQLYVTLSEALCNHAHIAFESLFILPPNYICLKNNFFSKIKQSRSSSILNTVNPSYEENGYSDVLDILVA